MVWMLVHTCKHHYAPIVIRLVASTLLLKDGILSTCRYCPGGICFTALARLEKEGMVCSQLGEVEAGSYATCMVICTRKQMKQRHCSVRALLLTSLSHWMWTWIPH